MLRQAIAPLARTVLRNNPAGKAVRRYHGGEHYKHPSMDDLPVPCGSWETQYKNNQAKYNIQLLCGIVFFGATLITAKASGIVYLNFNPPELKD